MQYGAPGKDGGPDLRGTVQAAVSRPFADEFRALETNTALLRQVASITGGEVLEADPTLDQPWRREGLTMPVSTRAIWLAIAVASLGLFIADVGIRRVRIEPAAIARSVGKAFGRSAKRETTQQVDTLRAAREKARQRTAQPEMSTGGQASAAAAAVAKAESNAESKAGSKAEPAEAIALSGEQEAPAFQSLSKPDRAAPAKPDSDEGGMSRLMRAKKRAMDEFNEDE